MNGDQWGRVAHLYQAALDQPAEVRDAFLLEASVGDDDVRREVASLLAQDAHDSMLDSSVLETAADLIGDAPDLTPGDWLGPYRIEGVLGIGGMGEVYRATDTRLDRTVALKILPHAFASEPRLRERFDREAKAVAALGHPHICALHDVGRERVREGQSAGAVADEPLDFLVLEYVDGETLASRLRRGALPLDQALRLAVQIADALATAHRHGLIHRDLKPGNVMITKAGAKLLDFGLAKQTETPLADEVPRTAPSLAEMTAEGAIIGTVQYMAPEQVEGRPTDARTDIFAFGAVVYEMVTGRKAFSGGSRAGLIGAILKDEPRPLAPGSPSAAELLERVIFRCLAKDPDDRWQSAADLTSELQWIATHPKTGVSQRSRLFKGSAVAAAAIAVAGFVFAWWMSRAPQPADRQLRVSVLLPDGADMLPISPTSRFALSPDGRRLAFAAAPTDGRPRLFIRTLNQLQATELAGTTGAFMPFWSPDSTSVGFVADGALKRIDLADGSVRTLANAAAPGTAAWSRDGVILFTPTRTSGLHRIPAHGGASQPVTTPDASKGELAHVAPYFLPDGRHFLYFALTRTASGRSVPGGTYGASLDGSEPTRPILARGSNVAYAAGRLIFGRESTVVAQPFDPTSLTLSGEPTTIVDRVIKGGYFAYGQGLAFSASEDGTIAYQGGEAAVELTWFDRQGLRVGRVGDPLPPDAFTDVSLSRDGRQAAANSFDMAAQAASVWSYDLARGLRTRLTFENVDALAPVFAPDGTRLAYASRRRGPLNLFVRSADGSGSDVELLASPQDKYPMSWSADGRHLLYVVNPPGELWALPLSGNGQPFPLVRGPFSIPAAQLSPDGRWIAYASTESGRSEIYVTEFPKPLTKTVVSTADGDHPRWRGDGRELFYRSRGMLMAAPVAIRAGRLTAGAPQALIDVRPAIGAGGASRYFYDVSADGERFLVGTRMLSRSDPDGRGEATTSISLLMNWPATLAGR
jgi:serine/threonine protein kinase/dipeptidyl aminopeptidase/acylaminoacyl peptidase